MSGSIGFTEILIVMVVLLIFFGAKRLPELAKGIGNGVKELKNSMKDIEQDISLDNTQQKK